MPSDTRLSHSRKQRLAMLTQRCPILRTQSRCRRPPTRLLSRLRLACGSRGPDQGCLLAGAAGDALGAPVEFLSWAGIQAKFGPDGVTALASPGRFTDDTQMTLFTLEGLIRASVRGRSKGICHPPSVVRHTYLR